MWSVQDQQQLCFVVGQSPKSQVEGLEIGFGATYFIKASGQFLFFDGVGMLAIFRSVEENSYSYLT